jgi:hypothetical protein
VAREKILMKQNIFTPSPLRHWLWIVPAIIGAGLTGLTLFVLPPDRVLNGIPEFLFKILPLVMAVFAIALFPNQGHRSGGLLVLAFIFYMGYIDSVYFIQIGNLIDAAVADTYQEQFPSFYTFHIFVNAFTILLAMFAYRLGGATPVRVIKLGLAGILVMISGLNDLSMWVLNPWPNGERPFVFSWASHVAIFIGRDPNLYHMLAFLGVHLALIGIILWAPVERWMVKKERHAEPNEANSSPVGQSEQI